MMHKRLFLFLLTLISLIPLKGQDHQQSYESIDVLSYRFNIALFDTTNEIIGIADIDIAFKKDVGQFQLDLTGDRGDSLGMKVESVTEDDHYVPYLLQDDHIILYIPKAQKGTHRRYRISYRGIPTDGLIISKNKFGDRTFFGDNWPNRGHNWLPMVDHPSDCGRCSAVRDTADAGCRKRLFCRPALSDGLGEENCRFWEKGEGG